MKKYILLILLASSLQGTAQINSSNLIQDALGFHSSLIEYRKLEIDWKMDGKVQAELNEGINNLDEHKPAIAIGDLSNAIRLDTSIVGAYYYRAIAYKLVRRYSEAEEDLRRLREWKKEPYLVSLESGKVAQLKGNLREAKNHYQECIDLNNKDVDAYNLLGNLLIQMNHLELAKNLTKKIIKTEINNPEPYIRLGLLEIMEKKDMNAGHLLFEKAWKSDSTNKKAVLIMAISKLRAGNLVAIPYWDKLVSMAPANLTYRAARSAVNTAAGRYEIAYSDMRNIMSSLETDPNQFQGVQGVMDHLLDHQYALNYTTATIYGLSDIDQERVKKAYCLLAVGQFRLASDELKKCQKNGLTKLLLGMAHEHGGSHELAFAYYNEALQYDQDIIDAHKKRGIYRMETADWLGAVEDFDNMIRLNPQSSVAYQYKGIALYGQQKFKLAIADFTKALSFDSTSVDVLEYRGLCYEKTGAYFYAISDYLKANSKERVNFDKFEDAYKAAVRIDTARALKELVTITGALPDYFPAHYHKIDLMVIKKQSEGIKTHIDRALRANASRNDDQRVSRLLTIKGDCMISQPEKAKTFYKRAVTKDSKNSAALLSLGKVLLELNERKDALENLRKAADLGHPEAVTLLAQIRSDK
jgi:tetratricopeptide (TPR) repeat protein